MTNATATIIHAGGRRTRLAAASGTRLVQAALHAGIDEIEAICGGSGMCGTCHVMIDPADAGRLPRALPAEEEILDCVEEGRRPTSRLACQIEMGGKADGLVAYLPQAWAENDFKGKAADEQHLAD